MINYEIGINKLNPKHINDARYSYEVKVSNDGCVSPHAGVYGCTLTLKGAKRRLRKELRRINNILAPNVHSNVINAKGSIEDLRKITG